MKKITFIALVSLSLTVAATAAQNDNQATDDVYTLPSYNVTTPRYSDAEKAVAQSLAQFRTQVRATTPLRVELETLGTVAQQPKVDATRALAVQAVTKLPARS
jgi:hypothetical protein